MIEAPEQVPIERLLPHRPPMLAVERLLSFSAQSFRAAVTLRPGTPCFEDGRFRPIFCLEVMAQAVGAGIAYGAAAAGEPRDTAGFVVGVGQLRLSPCDRVLPGNELIVESQLEVEVPPAAEHAVRLLAGREELARATLRLLVGGARPPTAATLEAFGGFQASRVERDGERFAITVGSGHPYLAGHFPGAPVLPAVGQLRFVEHAAGLSLSRPCELASVERARFFQPVVPGVPVELSLDLAGEPDLSWSMRSSGRPVARGSGRLR